MRPSYLQSNPYVQEVSQISHSRIPSFIQGFRQVLDWRYFLCIVCEMSRELRHPSLSLQRGITILQIDANQKEHFVDCLFHSLL